MTKWLFLYFVLLFFSCTNQNKKQITSAHQPKVVEAKGYVVPKDSMSEPVVIPVDESKLKKVPAGKPTTIQTNTNVHIAINSNIRLSGKPRICTPGKDTFSLPQVVRAIESTSIAGIPEITPAKDPFSKDQNPYNFSSFSELQGLKNEIISCLLQDKAGNLWFGTVEGVCKYDGYNFSFYTEKEGLSSNYVESIFEDKAGNLWFGTQGGGVDKYDGYSFTCFDEKGGLSNIVLSIEEDKLGNLWFGTTEGVCKFDGRNFTRFSEKEGLINNRVSSILEDKFGNIWICTHAGVSKYDGNSFENFTVNEGLSGNRVLSILEDRSGNLWFSTLGNGVTKYDGTNFTRFSEKEGLSNNVVFSMLEDKFGNIWFCTDGGGICQYNGNFFTHFTEKEGLVSNHVKAIVEDRTGNLWLGNKHSGLSKYNGHLFTFVLDLKRLDAQFVRSILQDRFGNMWFGTWRGVCKYDGKNLEHYTEKEGLDDYAVSSLLEDKLGNLWFSIQSSGVCKFDGENFIYFTEKDGLVNNNVFTIEEDKEGNIWFGTLDGVCKYDGKSITRLTKKEGLSSNVVISILEDKEENLWFGTDGGGVSKYDGISFTHYTEKEGLSNNSILSILEDKNGNLWFGTYGGGVTKYDGTCFTHFTDKEGLSNNFITSMHEDKAGNIWIGTGFGLVKLRSNKIAELNYKLKSKSISESDVFFNTYTLSDGFLGLKVNHGNTIVESKDGFFWIATNDKLTLYHPPENDATDTFPPDIQLISLGLYNEKINWQDLEKKKDTIIELGNGVSVGDFEFEGISKWYGLPKNLSLAYNNNYLTFNFIGITMNQPKKVKYKYILEGNDVNWSALTSKNEVAYGNLPHGTYTFKVKAMNSEGYWSKHFEYTFTIRPPWWKTTWFRALYISISVLALYLFFRWRTASLRKQKEVLEKTVEERTAEVVHQKEIIEEKHKEITDSINYAERIQRSFLATRELLDEHLKDYFVLFQPKDVVSGDFYWAAKLSDGNFAYVTADSTGHGVPGAIMSILNISSLEKSIETKTSPSEILNATRKIIIERLKKDGSAEGGKDGMDASLIVLNKERTKLICAAANNPVWIIRNNEIIEITPDKMPVGKHDKDQTPFTQQEFDVQKGDLIYTLTDGMPDQFGGPKGKKYKYKQLQELLLSIAHEPLAQQKEKLLDAFNNWRGDLEQVDDVTIVGVRV